MAVGGAAPVPAGVGEVFWQARQAPVSWSLSGPPSSDDRKLEQAPVLVEGVVSL